MSHRGGHVSQSKKRSGSPSCVIHTFLRAVVSIPCSTLGGRAGREQEVDQRLGPLVVSHKLWGLGRDGSIPNQILNQSLDNEQQRP
ncbi:hypothetical protein TNCV_3978051 [Trichonephila clavipes]|nr:hypothetical protein TNCV_3978051 [Trichonephila clavipes]